VWLSWYIYIQAHERIPGDMMESEGREERGVMTKKIPAHGKARSGADLLQILPGIDSISTEELNRIE
jgi:hypothetical protein